MRPEWPWRRIEPLSDPEIETILSTMSVSDEVLRSRIVTRAGGNPLFAEELAAALEAEPDLELPRTLEALLVSRLEGLAGAERRVLEPGAVEGAVFHLSAVAAITGARDITAVEESLAGLVAGELLRPEASTLLDEPAFGFRSILIRDAAYAGIPKRRRSRLHADYADWLVSVTGERASEWEEVLGYHLEQSYRYRAETAALSEEGAGLARQAAGRLASAGRRAISRGDVPAASGLLQRAVTLLDVDPPLRRALVPELARATRRAGDPRGALRLLDGCIAEAAAAGESELVMRCRLEASAIELYTVSGADTKRALALAEDARRLFSASGDGLGLAEAHSLVGHVNWLLCRGAAMEEAFNAALGQAALREEVHWQGEMLRMLPVVYHHGPTPVPHAIRRCEEILEIGRGNGALEVSTLAKIAGLRAMLGDFAEARRLLEECRRMGNDIGLRGAVLAMTNYEAAVFTLEGDLEQAEEVLRGGIEALRQRGEISTVSTASGLLGRVLEAKGDLDAAYEWTKECATLAAAGDFASQILWRGVRGRVLAGRGELDLALAHAHEAAELASRTDFVVWHGEALLDLAAVLRAADEPAKAIEAASQALALFEAKQHLVLAEAARRLCGRGTVPDMAGDGAEDSATDSASGASVDTSGSGR